MSSYLTCNRKFQKKQQKKFKKLENTTKAYFQAKISWKRPRKRENKNKKSFRCVPTRPVIENSKKNTKKFKKLENTIIASFHAKISQKRPKKSENKSLKKLFRWVPTRPVIENFKKNSKKIQKIRKYRHSFFSSQNKLGKAEKEKK